MKNKKNIIIILSVIILTLFCVWFFLLSGNNFQLKDNNKENEVESDNSEEISINPLNLALESDEPIYFLDLFNENLTNLPPDIGKLTELEHLIACDNRIEELPSEFFNLQNLKSVDLENNLLTELSPDIMKLQNLERLYLANNNLSSLPIEIGELKKLQDMTLQGNNFSVEEKKKIEELLPDTNIIFENSSEIEVE